MALRACFISILFVIVLSGVLLAYDPAVETLDAGSVTTFVLNDATFGYDPTSSRVAGVGMYYPGDSYLWVVSGAGIWVGGYRDGEWRVTASGLESDFVPGPYPADGVSYDTLYPIYKVNQGDDVSNDDYRNWPVVDGAPTNAAGLPLIKGAQALYTVFNDADTSRHVLEEFTATLPLGVEVRAYYYVYDDIYQVVDSTLTQVVFVDYEVMNITEEPLDSCIVTIYADPDVGFSRNDRVASIDTLQAVYAYNDADVDPSYGPFPPVVGMTVLKNRAVSSNFYWRCRSTDEDCVVIDTVTKVVNLMKGEQPQGGPYFDPETSLVTRFPYGGDPVDSAGWLVESSEDYRMMLNTAPVTLESGESVYMTAAMTVIQGDNVEDGIIKTRELIAKLRGYFEPAALRPEVSVANGEAVRILGRGPSADDWGGRFLGGGLDRAEYYLDFAVDQNNALEDQEIAFSKSARFRAMRFERTNGDFRYAGEIDVPFRCTRSKEDKLLWIAVLDTSSAGGFVDTRGRLLPIVLTVRDFETYELPALGEPVANIAGDLTYVLDLDESPEYMAGSRIVISKEAFLQDFSSLQPDLPISFSYLPAADGFAERSLRVKNPTGFWQENYIVSSEPTLIGAVPNRIQLAPGDSEEIFLRVSGRTTEQLDARLLIESTSLVTDTLNISVELLPPAESLFGDADADGEITFSDLLQMIAILYKNAPILVSINQLDADCDGDFDLTDALLFINYLYRGAEIPCQQAAGP